MRPARPRVDRELPSRGVYGWPSFQRAAPRAMPVSSATSPARDPPCPAWLSASNNRGPPVPGPSRSCPPPLVARRRFIGHRRSAGVWVAGHADEAVAVLAPVP
jgi:hypothetical protein